MHGMCIKLRINKNEKSFSDGLGFLLTPWICLGITKLVLSSTSRRAIHPLRIGRNRARACVGLACYVGSPMEEGTSWERRRREKLGRPLVLGYIPHR